MKIKYIQNTAFLTLFSVILPIALCCSCIAQPSDDKTDLATPTVDQIKITNGDAQFDRYVPFLTHRRVALVANHSSVVDGRHLCDTLIALGVEVVKVFAPEHGFRGVADAGAKIDNSIDELTGLPIISLYGKNKKPTPAQMADIDVVLYDLQDVGARFYTYISTMHYMMEACAERGISFIVLDRPNPNGDYIDGPVLESDCKSFVGMHPIPVVYGMTAGELAIMICGERWLDGGRRCDLKVVTVSGYSHSMALPLDVAPSPNLPTLQAVRLYPSLCLFEATNISVGRGTEHPFEVIGAPNECCGDFRFTPVARSGATKPLHENVECFGLDLTEAADPHSFTLEYILRLHDSVGDSAFWKSGQFFDRLAGTKALRRQISEGLSADSIRATWQPGLEKFKALRSRYLLYDVPPLCEAVARESIDWPTAMHSVWVDSVYNSMTLRQRIAQLIWVTVNNSSSERELQSVRRTVSEIGVGGVLILQSTASEARYTVDMLQAASRIPLLVAADAENGPAMKFAGVVAFPKSLTIGSITNADVAFRMGQLVANQVRACGIDVNFAPVVDVNTNPRNPVIGQRSFGENADEVAIRASAFARGLQSMVCAAVAKHFPGHGDTNSDSHSELPVVRNSRQRIDTVDIQPYRQCIADGIIGVMSAHIAVPAIDSSGTAASLSHKTLHDMLRNELSFNGIVISDAVNMLGIRIAAGRRSVEALAIAAGNDVVEFSLDAGAAVDSVEAYIKEGIIDECELEQSVRRVLALKEWCNAGNTHRKVGLPELFTNSLEVEIFTDSLFSAAVTVLIDNGLDQYKTERIHAFDQWQLPRGEMVAAQTVEAMASQIKSEAEVRHWIFVDEKTLPQLKALLQIIGNQYDIAIAYAGNPYRLRSVPLMRRSVSLVEICESSEAAKRALSVFVRYGGIADGRLPVTVGEFRCGSGTKTVHNVQH